MDTRTPLIGRDAELEALAALLDGPGGNALVVYGAAGSGKTALLEAASDAARESGRRVLRATGYQSESQCPYAGLHQLLLPVLEVVDDAGDDTELLHAAFGIDEKSSEAAASAGAAPAEFSPADVARVCQGLLRYVHRQQRTVIIVDDFQWLDSETVRVLSVLCRRLTSADVDLVIAMRGSSAPEEFGVRTRELGLEPLSSEDALSLIRRTAATLHGHTREAVLRRAAGNPLALIEFAKAIEADTHGQLGLFDDGPLPVSDRLEALYGSRVRKLPPPTRRALLFAAAAGTDELATVLAFESIAISEEDWAHAAQAGLITMEEPGSGARVPRFVHPLMRSAVYKAATHAQKQDAHRVIARALASWPVRSVWHLALSVWHPDEEVAALLAETAAQLKARGGFYAAATAMARAAELSPDPRDAYRRQVKAAELAAEADERRWMVELAERALKVGTEAGMAADELVDAQPFIAQGKVYLGSDPNLVRGLLASLETAVEHPCWETVALLSFATTAAYYAPDPRQLAELRRLTDRLPDPYTRPELWDEPETAGATLQYARYTTTPFLRRDEPLDPHGILDPALAEGHRMAGYGMYAAAAYILDQPEAAAHAIQRADDQRRADHIHTVNPTALAMIASNNEMWGRWRKAAEQAEEVIDLSIEAGEHFNVAFGHITAGLIAARQGRTDQARRHARAADRAGDGVSRSVPTRTRHLQGLISLAEGDYVTAYTLLRSTLVTDERVPAHYHLSHYAVADFALCGLLTHQRDDAAAVLDGIMAHANATTPGGAHLSRRLRLLHDLARALVAEPDAAEALFLAALGPGAERWPFDEACVRLHYGEHLRRQRRIVEARPLLTAALETFRDLDARPWVWRAETELNAAGARADETTTPSAHAEPPTGAFARLTAQQRAVAELAAHGLTNPQIGARLNISPKTVGNHLSRIFELLEISGRAQLRDLPGGPDTSGGPAH